jgi:uncharacterized protein (DUF697 family)
LLNDLPKPDREDRTMMDRRARADEMIAEHVAGSIAMAAIPVPVVDLIAVTAVQLSLLRKLGRLYDARVGVGLQGALAVGLLGAALPRMAASALKILPGVGWVGGAFAQAALSGAATWALANALRDRLELPEIDEEIANGANVARTLARVERLWRRGLLDADEYARLRSDLLDAV